MQIETLEAGEKSPAFREITLEDAKPFIGKWHRAGRPAIGRFCFGAFQNGEMIAASVIVDSRGHHPRVGEIMCMAKNPAYDTFQMSKFLKHICKAIRGYYDFIVSFCLNVRGRGAMFQGAYWNYDGIFKVGNYTLWGDRLERTDLGNHLYWKAITDLGTERASIYGLRSMPYPRVI